MARFTLPTNEYQPVRVFMASVICEAIKSSRDVTLAGLILTKNGQFASMKFV